MVEAVMSCTANGRARQRRSQKPIDSDADAAILRLEIPEGKGKQVGIEIDPETCTGSRLRWSHIVNR